MSEEQNMVKDIIANPSFKNVLCFVGQSSLYFIIYIYNKTEKLFFSNFHFVCVMSVSLIIKLVQLHVENLWCLGSKSLMASKQAKQSRTFSDVNQSH